MIKITYKINCFDSVRFMASSLSNLADNLAEGLRKDDCINCKSCLEYVNVKDGLLLFNCPYCNKNNQKEFHQDFAKIFESNYQFCEENVHRFCLMLRKGIYPYEYMDS